MPEPLLAIPSSDRALRRGGPIPELAAPGPDPAFVAKLPGQPAIGSAVAEGWLVPAPVPGIRQSVPAPARRSGGASLGIFLYLASVVLVGAATIVVFFGTGFLLLRQPAHALVATVPPRPAPAAAQPAQHAPARPLAAVPLAAPPPAAMQPARLIEPQPRPPQVAPPPLLAVKIPAPAPAASALPAPQKLPSPPAAAGAKVPAAPPVPDPVNAELVARGDVFLRAGDIASARLFYERAADAGDGQAALRLGATFDPAFLAGVGLRSLPGDPSKALSWYGRALGAGSSEAQHHRNRDEKK